MSSTNKANRGKNIWTHCVGRKSFGRVIDEKAKATGVKPTRLRVYTITRQLKSGAFINKHAEDIIGKARVLTTQPQEDTTDFKPMTDDQAFDTLFPPGRPGRFKCTSRNFTGQLRSGKNAHFQQHQNELNALQTQLDETRKALHETQLQLQQQQEQLKEVDTLRGDVGQLLSMVKTLSSTNGFSFPPFQTFNNGDELGRANIKEPKLPASQSDVQPMEDRKEASQVAIDVLTQFKKKQKLTTDVQPMEDQKEASQLAIDVLAQFQKKPKLTVGGKIQKFRKRNKCFKKERVEYRELSCKREPIDDLSVDM